MIGQFVADDYYFCLAKTDILLLKKNKSTSGFFIKDQKVYDLILRIDSESFKSSDFFFIKEKETFIFLITGEEAEEFLEKGSFSNRLGASNVYIFSETHQEEEYIKYRNMLNAIAYTIEKNWKTL